MKPSSASIHVTKLAAAQRQLRAAIRMFFLDEDDLAVHTIAAASYSLISDLKADRGLDEVSDYYRVTIFYAVRDYHRGKLPRYLADSPEAMSWIREMADNMPITADSDVSDISVTVSQDAARDYWNRRKFVANYLKHADRDSKETLDLETVDNLTLLMQSVASYGDLARDGLDPEGLVLWLFHCVEQDLTEGIPELYTEFTNGLSAIEPDIRKRFCYEWIERLKQAS